MLDFFSVITKGGLVLWYFQDAAQRLDSSITAINALIRNVVLQERSGATSVYGHENYALKVFMDNEFELLYVVIYQKILQLSYIDKFLSDIQRKFREMYLNDLRLKNYFKSFEFTAEYNMILQAVEAESKLLRSLPQRPRTFQESSKSKKTIDSMVEHKGRLFSLQPTAENVSKKKKKKKGKGSQMQLQNDNEEDDEGNDDDEDDDDEKIDTQQLPDDSGEEQQSQPPELTAISDTQDSDRRDSGGENGSSSDGQAAEEAESNGQAVVGNGNAGVMELGSDAILRNRQMLFQGKLVMKKKANKQNKQPKKGKEARVWDLANTDSSSLDYSRKGGDNSAPSSLSGPRPDYLPDSGQIGTLAGSLRNMDVPAETKKTGLFSLFQSLVSGKTLDASDVAPVLEKFRDLLIAKNVAAEIASKLCSSVETKLIGKHVGSFEGVTSVVRATLTESLMLLLTPKRRLDILRDVREAQHNRKPYAITFCGVNGVGKSTNLAKVSFWLIENNFRVLIAACDTFRAGAVEQLRTHVHHLNALHPPEKHGGKTMVHLYEQGYGKDAADIARMAIDHARKHTFDVVLIDTAGRMQDNEPLMRALAKLILVNEPDLTLFVGEALVGNEAVDQLVKFNKALANHSNATNANTHMIDGILLTKFDTIDDKVGAAISMTYITGQPIVFVGTGQTYADLRNLDAKAVVHLLMQ
ncbi:signal recognition particle receptor subunit alpha homolog isoform X2 [Hyalella azteca]|uniref:Signal recognition particle receptor subunit alpha homolog isoform X2 n=1 Tax=Hyalella azteca TaxID=294128 RepID=A0A8B7NVR1_HYAAZ|nr:signal recognition particle receptor subunit alpha homolog isoform X2 [Hyalella azteca]